MRPTIKIAPILLLLAAAMAGTMASRAAEETTAEDRPAMKRYMVVRTFPAGALEGLDEQGKQTVNAKNADNGVRWIQSYASSDLTKTFCVYEGPSEEAIRQAAKANDIPVDSIVEIPVDLLPQ